MGHVVYRDLDSKAKELWSKLIHGDHAPIDLRTLLSKWPENLSWGYEFARSLRDSDPILSLQVEVLSSGFDPSQPVKLQKREHFERLLNSGTESLNVPQTPITGYASKNPEEAFCEVLGMLVAYGSRAVHEKIVGWLEVVLPGQVKLAFDEQGFKVT